MDGNVAWAIGDLSGIGRTTTEQWLAQIRVLESTLLENSLPCEHFVVR
ncbi:hypothetical protein [Bradyrhizobium sp. Tv2a-2]|nr:hypothetical protein [Bradyrhizobium sp. Tv2a-2]